MVGGSAYFTDKGFEVCTRAIQVHGGYSFCTEYKVEQFARDCKMLSIYEGTNGIQALDLFGRRVKMNNGAVLEALFAEIDAHLEEASGMSDLGPYAEEVGSTLESLRKISAYLVERSSSDEAYLAYSWATPHLEIFDDVVLGWLFLWQAK